MKLLKKLYALRLKTVPTSLVIILLVIALLGFADSVFLTIKHLQNVVPPCSLTSGCEDVLTSSYSTLAGIPVALLGALYYLAVMIGLFIYIESENLNILKMALLLTSIGFVFSVFFVFLQVFIIKSLCMYCLISALTSILLFAISTYIFPRYRETDTLSA